MQAEIPPTPSSSSSHWNVTQEHLDKYRNLFESIDHRDPSVLGPDEAKELLDRSGLPNEELAQIWQLSDVDGDSQLTLIEFACAMHLVSRRLQGFDLPESLPPEMLPSLQRILTTSAPVVRNGSPGSTYARKASVDVVDTNQSSVWSVTPEQCEQYSALFAKVEQRETGFVGPDEAREVLERSQLPQAELGLIWRLADVDGDGQLVHGEFAVAVHLVAGRRRGLDLPSELPSELVALAAGVAIGSQGHKADASSFGTDWAATPEELRGYRGIFEELDVRRLGRLGFNEVRDIFERSSLPQEELAHIWGLADADEDEALTIGEFACAMHLLQRRRQGAQLPPHCPLELSKLLGG